MFMKNFVVLEEFINYVHYNGFKSFLRKNSCFWAPPLSTLTTSNKYLVKTQMLKTRILLQISSHHIVVTS